jgi:hypothetical protein
MIPQSRRITLFAQYNTLLRSSSGRSYEVGTREIELSYLVAFEPKIQDFTCHLQHAFLVEGANLRCPIEPLTNLEDLIDLEEFQYEALDTFQQLNTMKRTSHAS